jgi:hypothetical protein
MAADGPGGGWLDGRQGRAVTQLDVCVCRHGFEGGRQRGLGCVEGDVHSSQQ